MSTEARPEPRERRALAKDQRGAIMVMGVFMAVLLVGALHYVMGLGETILYREQMQDAADSGAFVAAVMHARGMNLIALLNMVMASVIAVLVAMKLIQVVLGIAAGVATAICAACVVGAGCWACPIAPILWDAYAEWTAIVEEVEPIIHRIVAAIDYAQTGIKWAMPAAAQWKVVETGTTTYNQPTNLGVMWPLLEALPVEQDDSDLLCRKAGEQVGRLIVSPLSAIPGMDAFGYLVGDMIGSITATFSSFFCGESRDKADRVKEGVELGGDELQLRAFMTGDPPFDQAEEGVTIATWGHDEGPEGVVSGMRNLAKVSFAQAEFYYDDQDDGSEEDREEWMWHMNWRARLRRFEAPGLGGIGGECSACAGLIGMDLDEIVVH
jgi:hypothetical protein